MLTKPTARYIYLATPHTDPDKRVEAARETEANKIAAFLAELGLRFFSPISHSAPLIRAGADLEHAEWLLLDQPLLANAGALIVVCFPGWQDSAGIKQEIEFMRTIGRPIFFLSPDYGTDTVFTTPRQ